MSLDILIEGLLFYTGVPQKKQRIQSLFSIDANECANAIETLRTRLSQGALRVIETEEEIQLVTAPELSEFITELRKNELSKDIGKAGAETLAIVLYREPITRSEIDQIRGVNSGFILRNLETRGLISRKPVKNTHEFQITPALLQHLGITHKHELPHFSDTMNRIDSFLQNTETV